MVRIIEMQGVFYGLNLSEDFENEMEEIKSLIEQGNPVIIVGDTEDLEEFGIYDDVVMVSR